MIYLACLLTATGAAPCGQVVVFYRAFVEGAAEPFARSGPGNNDTVTFTVRDGHLCPALRLAVRSMKKGEKARVKVQPKYAFGEEGSAELGVPGGAALTLDVQLVGYHQVDELVSRGALMLKHLVEGEGWKTPGNQSQVRRLHLVFSLAALAFGATSASQRLLCITRDAEQ